MTITHLSYLELPSAATNGCSRCDEGRDTEEIITHQHHRIYHAAASSDLPPLGKWSIVNYTRKTSNHLANNHNNQPLGKKQGKLEPPSTAANGRSRCKGFPRRSRNDHLEQHHIWRLLVCQRGGNQNQIRRHVVVHLYLFL